jgi:hypothetical protein
MTAIVENMADFLPDFGIAATVGGVAVTGIFDNAFGDPLGIVAGTSPSLLFLSSAAPSAAVGNTVVVGGISYTIAELQPDGTGLMRLALKT